jgi:ribosomal protein S6--L-glutamate ligase
MLLSTKKLEPLIGVVGLPDGWSSQRLVDAVETKTGARHLIDLSCIRFDLASGRVSYDGLDLSAMDALIVKKIGASYRPELLDRLEMLHFLHENGVRVFSKPTSMMRLLDRLSCTVTLRLGGIPIPDTVVTEDIDIAVEAVHRFHKAILKPLFTSKARGMRLVEADAEARDKIEAFRAAGNHILYVQRMVELPGVDLGVVFLGGEYLASYARVARDSSWNTTTGTGGKYRRHEPSPDIIQLARGAQALFDLDFTCVDVAETPDGPVVFEVSAFGGFRGLMEADGINAADHYVEYVLRKLGHGT